MKKMKPEIIRVFFSGKKSHAAVAPDLGRSAFDALLLSISAAERLQKHLPIGAELEYAILSSGNVPANVVPDCAEGELYLTAQTEAETEWLKRRAAEIVLGAAEATGTICHFK